MFSLLAGCGAHLRPGLERYCDDVSNRCPTSDETIVRRLIFRGDSGEGVVDQQAVDRLVVRRVLGGRTTVINLGDNIYGSGLPAVNHHDYPRAREVLDNQLLHLCQQAVDVLMIPGNHDWDDAGLDGWNRVRNQSVYLNTPRRAERVCCSPTAAKAGYCKGLALKRIAMYPKYNAEAVVAPLDHVDLDDINTRLVFVDTQWFLHQHDRPPFPEADVLKQLARLATDAGGRTVIVAGHHPTMSYGSHGSAEPVATLRSWGAHAWDFLRGEAGMSTQDLSFARYARLIRQLRGATQRKPPLAYVAGHEHSLQVFDGEVARYVMVSGSGSKSSPFMNTPERTLYREAEKGVLVLDFHENGGVFLEAWIAHDLQRRRLGIWLKRPTAVATRP